MEERDQQARDAVSVGGAMRGISGPLLRQIRRFDTLDRCLRELTPKLMGQCAPFDVRLAPALDRSGAEQDSEAGVNTIYWYVASPTIEAALEMRKREMLARINARSMQLVEEFRYEQVGAERIAQQLNILSAEPD